MESMQGGGAEKVLLDLLESFDRNKLAITLLLVFRTGALLDRLPEDIEVIPLYSGKPHGFRRLIEHFVPGRDCLYRRDSRRQMKGRRFDATISFLEGPALKIHNCLLDLAPRNITWNHTNLRVSHWTKYLYSSVADEADDYRHMDSIVFVSEYARKDFSAMFHIDDNRLKVIPNMVNIDAIRLNAKAFNVEKRKFTMIALGRLVEVKRYDRMLGAVKILAEKGNDFELWILGTGPLEKNLKDMTHVLGLERDVKFLGFQQNPYPYLNVSDLMLMSSDTEGYGMAIFEAMALGKPVVATASSGAKSLIDEGEGVLTDFSSEAMADAIAELMDDEKKRARFSAGALAKAEKFDSATVMRQIYSLL